MKYRHFGKINQEKALLRGLALSMFKNGGIETFRNRGKDTQKFVEHILTIAKKGDLSARRRVSSLLAADRDTVGEIFSIVPKFDDRVSGFTRIVRLGSRKGDGSQMVRLEWVVDIKPEKRKKEVKKEEVPTKITRTTKKEMESQKEEVK